MKTVDHHYTRWGKLLLPLHLVTEKQSQEQAPHDEKAAEIAQAEAELAACAKIWRAKQDQKAAEEEQSEAHADDFNVEYLPTPYPGYDGPLHKIFDKTDVKAERDTLDAKSSEADQRRRTKALLDMLKERGNYRKLATIQPTWRNSLHQLQERFPNFVEVIDYLRICCALAEKTDEVINFRILLSGPPGTGKSMFAQAIAEWAGGGYACVRYESAQSAAEMAGSSEFWANTKAGKPFTVLTEGDYANPTFFLDEIDKVSADRYDPLGALYALLEPGTARQHIDLSWPFLRLDCSKINYIAACNDPERIPAPLMSRLRKFDIPAPTPDQSFDILRNIIRTAKADVTVEVEFSQAAMELLCMLPPRRMRQAVQEGLGRALYYRRDEVLPEDIPVEPIQQKRSIGFTAG